MLLRYSLKILLLIAISGFAASLAYPQGALEANPRLMVHKVDKRSITEKALNTINMSTSQMGRSFALIAGVDFYPIMEGADKRLVPAGEDMRKLVAYLRDQEFFDEIVLLKNEDMTLQNLRYFLQVYFPERVKEFPHSRFLFAYSGHGFPDGKDSYLLEPQAKNMRDKANAIDLRSIRVYIDNVVEKGYQVLVLLNACFSGAFLDRPFGANSLPLVATKPGAHAITAGGSDEPTWHIDRVGSGSVFFEKIIAALEDAAVDCACETSGKATKHMQINPVSTQKFFIGRLALARGIRCASCCADPYKFASAT